MKRKIILSFVLSAIAMSINAQEYNMKVNKVNGEVLTIATSEIKDVVFEEIKGKEEEPQDEPRFITMGGKNGQWGILFMIMESGELLPTNGSTSMLSMEELAKVIPNVTSVIRK